MEIINCEELLKEEEYEQSLMKDDIDQYINNKIYYSLYDVLLTLPYDFDQLDIFNVSNIICEKLKSSEKPELYVDDLFHHYIESIECGNHFIDSRELYRDYNRSSIIKECLSVVFSCVYVILFHSESSNNRIQLCLKRIKGIVAPSIFILFEPLTKNKKVKKLEKETATGQQYKPSKYDTFIKEVEKYHFSELPKLKALTEEKREELVKKLVESTPYAIAMLTFLEYPDYLNKKYKELEKKEAQYKHIAKALNIGKETVKGNFLAIKSPEKSKAIKYQANYYYINVVQKDYENILSK